MISFPFRALILSRRWITMLGVAGLLSGLPSLGLAQAGPPASPVVSSPDPGAVAGNSAPARHARGLFGAESVTRKSNFDPPSDDPAADINKLALPPQDLPFAPFVGNSTVILATSGNGLVMVRQPNCSLATGNVPFSYDLSDPYGAPVSKTANYDQLLHNEAGLTTVGGNFGGKCPDPTIGINASDILYVGTSTKGMRMSAVAGFSSTAGTNVLYTFVMQSNGSFLSSTQQALPSSNNPFGLVAADLNGDGNPDLIAVGFSGTTSQTSAMTVLLGNADGTFTVGQTYMLGAGQSFSAVIDDFNGDGKLDVAALVEAGANAPPGGSLSFFPGNGDGTFGTSKTLSLTTATKNLVAGDFNGDGKTDLASGSGGIFLGNGDGTFQLLSTPAFTSTQTGSSTQMQVAAGDFNKDGKLDLAASNGNQIFIFLGNGNGTFNSGNVYAGIGNGGYLTATDLDGDGNPDLYSGDAHGGVFTGDDVTAYQGYALMGRGDGTFVGAPQVINASFNGMEDLNADHNLDFIGISGNVFTTYYGNGDGTFAAAGTPLAASPFTYNNTQYTITTLDSYVTADLNGDGKEDIVYLPSASTSTNGPTLRVGFLTALGTGGGSFAAPTYTPVPSLVAGGGTDFPVTLSDLQGTTNQDGKFEIVYGYVTSSIQSNNTVTYYQGYATQVSNGDGTFAAPALTVTYSGTQQTNNPPPQVVSLADLNGDKIPDLIVYINPTTTTASMLQVMLGKSDGTFEAAINLPVISSPIVFTNAGGALFVSMAVGDVNGDGIPDVVAEGKTTSGGSSYYALGVALGKGDGTFNVKPPVLLANASGVEQLALGDFNGDGKVDVAITGGTNGIFTGNGDGTFQSLPSGNSNSTVLPALALELVAGQGPMGAFDLNGSGKIDLVAGDTFLVQTAMAAANTSSTTLTASASTIAAGQSLTLTATVTAASGTGAPSGTVTFLDGTTSLGTAAVSASGTATFSTATLAVGSHSLTAVYGGDSNFSGSTSSAVVVTVTAAPALIATTTKLSATPASAAAGATIAFTAVVSPTSGSTAPTGMVTFLDGATKLGTGTLASGSATFSTTALAAGAHTITAAYGGSDTFATSTSAAVAVTISAAAPGFTLGLSPASGTASGNSVTSTITVTPAGGFNEAVSLACSGAPQNATCTISPASVTPSGSTAPTATITIATNVSTSGLNRPRIPGQIDPPGGTTALAFLGGGALLGFSLVRRRQRWSMRLGLTLALLVASAFTGCGGGSSSSGSSSTTPAGTYTIEVTGTSGSISNTATYSLTVQ